MLKDPDMDEIVIEFCDEADDLCEQLEEILDQYEEDNSNRSLLEKYGQVVDRIMGTAKSIGVARFSSSATVEAISTSRIVTLSTPGHWFR